MRFDPTPKGPISGVTVSPQVWRQPYGHPGGEIAFVVQDVDPTAVGPVVDVALADWIEHLPRYVRATNPQLSTQWPVRLRAAAVPTTDGRLAVVASASGTKGPGPWSSLSWDFTRTSVKAVARHLGEAGLTSARITWPSAPRGHLGKRFAPPVVALALAPRVLEFWDDISRMYDAVTDALLDWIDVVPGPVRFTVGQLKFVVDREHLPLLLASTLRNGAAAVDLAVSDGLSGRSAAYVGGSLMLRHHGEQSTAGVAATELAITGEHLRSLGSTSCVVFAERPSDPYELVYPPWVSDGSFELIADVALAGVYWWQSLSRAHLSRCGQVLASVARTDDDGGVLVLGSPDDWVTGGSDHRAEGERLLGACLMDRDRRLSMAWEVRERLSPRFGRSDPKPAWAAEVRPTDCTEIDSSAFRAWDETAESYSQVWQDDRGRQVSLSQSIPRSGNRDSGSRFVEVAPGCSGFEVHGTTATGDEGLGWFWSGRDIDFSVYGDRRLHTLTRQLLAELQASHGGPRPRRR